MTVVDIPNGQVVHIPTIRLPDGLPFEGTVLVSDGETLVIEVSDMRKGRLPGQTEDQCIMNWETTKARRSCPIRICSRTDRKIVAQVIIEERRQAPRVRADIHLRYKIIEPSDVREVADEVMMRVNALGDPESETTQLLRKAEDPIEQIHIEISELCEMLKDLMTKVDRIEARLNGEIQTPMEELMTPIFISNCSSTGVGFITEMTHEEGDYVRMHMSLPTTPRTVIDCVGVVARNEVYPGNDETPGQSTRHDVGIRFTHIHESDRERLIQYLFRIQRRELRDRKEAMQALAEGVI